MKHINNIEIDKRVNRRLKENQKLIFDDPKSEHYNKECIFIKYDESFGSIWIKLNSSDKQICVPAESVIVKC